MDTSDAYEDCTDVVVIGAGMAGLTAATTLAPTNDVLVPGVHRPHGWTGGHRPAGRLPDQRRNPVHRGHRPREPIGNIRLAGDYQLEMPSLADAAASGELTARAVFACLS